MKSALRQVASLLLSVSILLTGQGLMGTLLPVRASLEEFSTFAIGTFGASYFLGFTIGCLRGGNLVQRVGHVRVFLAMTALASASPLVHGLIVEPWLWSVLRFVTGFCLAVLYVVIESWLNERSTNETRGLVFATYSMITLTVLAGGQMMTLLYDPTGMQLFAIASVLVSVAAMPVALSTSPSPEPPETVRLDIPKLYRTSPAGTIGCLAAGFANGAFWALAPVFTASASTNASLAAWFMTATVIGGAIGQWPLGVLSDRLGRRRLLILVSLSGAAIAAGIVTLVPDVSFPAVNLLGACWGAFAFPLYTIAVAHANDYAEPADYVNVSGGLLLMYGVGATLGPFVASAVMTASTPNGLYTFTAVVHIVLAAFAALRYFRRPADVAHEPIPFSDALATAQTTSPVYEEEFVRHATEDDADRMGSE